MNNWWYSYVTHNGYQVPAGLPPFQSDDLQKNAWGPFHCSDCAVTCGSFGKTEDQAYSFNHGSADESFCVFLVDY